MPAPTPRKFDLAAAKAELKASGYKGEPVIILEVAGSISQTASRVLVQNMKDVGFTVEQQPRDWPHRAGPPRARRTAGRCSRCTPTARTCTRR